MSARASHRALVVARTAIAVVVALVLLSAFAKLADLDNFRESLTTWTLIPKAAIPFLTVLVPGFEVVVGVLWLLGWRRRAMELSLLSLLLTFQTALWLQIELAGAPRCGCFGLIDKYFAVLGDDRWTVWRGVGMTAALGAALIVRAALERPPRTNGAPSGARAVKRGFTVVELLVVIVLVALLAALGVSALLGSRQRARATETLTRLRQHGAVFAAYAADNKDSLPMPSVPGQRRQSVTIARTGEVYSWPWYFTGSDFWYVPLCEAYYDSTPRNPVFYPAEHTATMPPIGAGSFVMSCSLMARPEFWDLSKRTGPEQYGPVRQSEALFPARKAVLLNFYWLKGQFKPGATPDSPVDSLQMDGGAARRPRGEFRPGVPGEGPFPGAYHPFDVWAGLHTLGGVRGTDFGP